MILRGLALLAALFSAACGLIVADGLRERPGRADVAVLFGNTVRPDGSPSPALVARLDRAVEVWRRGRAPVIVATRGFERSGVNEAPVMRRYLVAHGVPDSAIVEDPGGQNTWLTARDARQWMAAHGARRALLVSHYYHLPRCRLAFARRGVPDVLTAPARRFGPSDLFATAREVPAMVKYVLRRDF